MKPLFCLQTFCTVILFVSSCKKNVQDIPLSLPENQKTLTYLSFKNYEDYNKKQIAYLNTTEKERLQIEQEQGFTSMRTLYDKFDKKLIDMANRKDTTGYANLKLKMGSAIYWYGDEQHIPNCISEIQTSLVNKDGLVKIGDSLYMFRQDKIAVIKNGDASLVAKIEEINHNYEDKNLRISYLRDKSNTGARYMVPGAHPNGSSNTVQQVVIESINGGYKLRGQLTLVNEYVNGNNRGYALLNYYAEERVLGAFWTKTQPELMSVDGDLQIGLTKKTTQTTPYNIQRVTYAFYKPLDQMRSYENYVGGILLAISNYYVVNNTGPTRYTPQLANPASPVGLEGRLIFDDYLGTTGFWEYITSEQGPAVPVPLKPITPLILYGPIKGHNISLTFN